MTRMDFYKIFKDDINIDWSINLYTHNQIGEEGDFHHQEYCFSSSYTEGMYHGYCLAVNQMENMSGYTP